MCGGGGSEIKGYFGSILLGKRFLRFSKNGQFMQMGYTVGKTKKGTQNDMTDHQKVGPRGNSNVEN